MTHYLVAVVQLSTHDAPARFRIDFKDGFENQVRAAIEQTARFPDFWTDTILSTDLEHLAWQERGSLARLSAFLNGCLQHGWPFVAYVAARVQDDPSVWLPDYEHSYLGWWASRRSFAEEVATSGGHFIDDGEQLADELIDEICGGFLVLDIDGQVLAFDLIIEV